ncbi:S24 family peptidase [Flavobacterium sp. WV_118_3]|uniref:S24 family peptidase n=1 Tax=Flavobacterium sp. WV_118_3 TaxID=3151764 RepID=UPI00321A7066
MSLPIENQRIKEIIKYYCNGNELQFSREIGVSQPRINRLFSIDSRSNKYPLVSFEITQAIINKFVDVSADWIMTGKGEMLKSKRGEQIENASVFKLKSDRTIKNQAIPLYNIEASAGIVTLFSDSSEAKPVDYIQIPNLPKCDGAIYVTGDSMYPLLKSGDIIMYKQVHNIRENIFFGEMYLISFNVEGDEMVTVKYVQKSDRGDDFIKLVSQNKYHHDKDIQIANISAMALVKASIRINSMS